MISLYVSVCALLSDFEMLGLACDGTHDLFYASSGVVTQLRARCRYIFREDAQVLHGIEDAAFCQVVVGETRFCTTQTRVVRTRFTTYPIPEDTVTAGLSHRPTTADLIEEATTTLSEVSINLMSKADGIGTAGLYEIREEGFGAVVLIDEYVPNTSSRNRYQNLGDPIRVSGAARNIDYG